ncbi:MAG: metallophosphoesterase [Oscillospiraceae bacterium]
MALFTIADLHLSLGGDKPMDIFAGWQDYVQRLQANWRRKITPEDTVVLGGDNSWAMALKDTAADFGFIDALPGAKVLLKGNHDYWWSTRAKMEAFFAQCGFKTLSILHNNCLFAEGVALCGTRGWMLEAGEAHDQKVLDRELGRLQRSLEAAQQADATAEKLVFLHYPPVYHGGAFSAAVELMQAFGVRRCFYGHLHGPAIRHAVQGVVGGIEYRLVSADALLFDPLKVEETGG